MPGNQTTNLSVCRPALNSLSHTSQARTIFLTFPIYFNFLRIHFCRTPWSTLWICKNSLRMALGPTSRLDTRFIMMRSGRSMVLAMVRTTSRASLWVGQSKRLYITSCFWVHRRSSFQGIKNEMQGQPQRLSQRPRIKTCYIALMACASQVTSPDQQGSRWTCAFCNQRTGYNEWRGEPELPSRPIICSQNISREPRPFFTSPPYLVHKQHSGFLRGSLGAKSLCQQFYCMVSCCLLACHLLHWGKTSGKV